MQNQQKTFKKFMIKTVASFAQVCHMNPRFAQNVKWLLFVVLAKINGKSKKEDILNVQIANLLNHLESFLEKNYNQWIAFWLFV